MSTLLSTVKSESRQYTLSVIAWSVNERLRFVEFSNDLRLTGRHETGHIGSFSSGVAHRGASIRIPRHCEVTGQGYLEDRRVSS